MTKFEPLTSAGTARKRQEIFVANLRGDSCFGDPRIPLGGSPPAHPEFGLSVAEHFAWKHGPRGPGYGQFYPLHQLASAKRRGRNWVLDDLE